MAVSLSLPVPAAVPREVSAAGAESPQQRFDRVMTAHGAALTRLAASYERDPHEREDLLQDIALALWTALPRFRGNSSERTFVFRVAHNRALTHRGRCRAELAGLDVAEAVPDPGPDPQVRAERSQSRERLLAAVRALPPGSRETVTLRLEGLTNTEIAEVLGLTDNAVAVRLNRALRTLRARLGPPGGDR